MRYRDGKIGRRNMLAAAGAWAVWDSNGKLGATEASMPSGAPALAHHIAAEGGGSVQDHIDRLTSPGGGSVVNISSMAGLKGIAGMAAYCASKGAIRMMSKAVAQIGRAHV